MFPTHRNLVRPAVFLLTTGGSPGRPGPFMNRMACRLALMLALSVVAVRPALAAWAMKRAPLMTRWAADVRPDAVLPEYPRPQMVRADWLNLNGVWEYQPGKGDDDAVPTGRKLSGEILVPFPVESAISGVMEHHDRLWYRRAFTVPAAWRGRRIVLHFGAVDYESEVFVNGKSAGVHKGGYDPFGYDVTPLLAGDGPQELIVRVFDSTNAGGQPRGKQTLKPGGIMYTATTGIWQTVWLEPVASGGIDDLTIVPDVDGGAVRVTPGGVPADADVTVTVTDGNRVVGTRQGRGAAPVSVPVPDAKLWSPDQPFLYDLRVTVARGGRPVDQVGSYFGMRKVSLGLVNGVTRLLLNGRPVFQFGPLDQGFWPDGIYTAPTEAAMKYDIDQMKALGFNMVRKHIKVEPARWYYWTDHLGLLVWQDMPSANSYPPRGSTTPLPAVDSGAFERELTRMVETLRNVPSIVMWETFNEGQGQHDTGRLVDLVKRLDPTRLVDEASGGKRTGAGDVYDAHAYPSPDCPPPTPGQALVCGEFGGIGLDVAGHRWSSARPRANTTVTSPTELVEVYAEFADTLRMYRDRHGLSAAVYTQLTDVENEINGLMTYDRLPKADVAALARATRFELPPATYTPLLPTAETEAQPWRYTTDAPPAGDAWTKPGFDDAGWKQGTAGFGTAGFGTAGFGTAGTSGAGPVGTAWSTPDVWLRRTVDLRGVPGDNVARVTVRECHVGTAEMFINGVRAFYARGSTGDYINRPPSDRARAALKPGVVNVIAVHCRAGDGGRYIDVGLLVRQPLATR